MRRKLVRIGNGRGVVIDEPVLELIGASNVEEFEVTTNGRELTLTPVKPAQASGSAAPSQTTGSPAAAQVGRCEDPKESIRALHVAQARGFTQEHFRRIHHFGPKASIQAHLNHCAGTGRFTSKTNIIVCERLLKAIDLRERGVSWDDAITAAVQEFPFPKQ